jgi:ribonucleoside-diphosphate reductase alpha subunit
MDIEDQVTKRDGRLEVTSFDKILTRVKKLGKGELNVNYTGLVQKVIDRLYNKIKTTEIDELTAQQCASLSTTHPDYGVLASRILISNHQKNTPDTFKEAMSKLYHFRDVNNKKSPIIGLDLWLNTTTNHETIEKMIDYNRDYLLDYFGFKTLERAYLMRVNKVIIERPQHMWMRVALAIHGKNMEKVKTTYDLMSQKYFTHATPTLFNAGTQRPQLSSCYLIGMESDSIKGIYNTLADCASISKWAGGIGMHIHNVRAAGSHIRGTNGTSNGIVPMLRVFNNTARYCDQGGGKRKGSFAIYLEPWHADIESFLDMKKNHGDEEQRARDLFYALWIPDLFMKRVKKNGNWTLMCPDKCPGLSDVYGEEFETLYENYEKDGKGNKTMKARDIWLKILDSQIETGTPYMLYKDACNKKSNQKNLGTIKSSNLCTEIIEYSDDKETAVCNLASIGLSKFVKPNDKVINSVKLWTRDGCKYCTMAKLLISRLKMEDTVEYTNVDEHSELWEEYKLEKLRVNIEIKSLPQIEINGKWIGGYNELEELLRPIFDYEKLHEVTKVATENLNKVIDINFYPTEKTKRSNMRHRPIGLGVQGLADVYAKMNIPFYSDKAKEINKKIFETMYHAALEASVELSKKEGPYETFKGCPAEEGILQFDMWNVVPGNRYNWDTMKEQINMHGLRNSLLLAPMPTASTSQILGNNECFEPFTSNIYVRRTLAGEFVVINKYLMKELIDLNLWNEKIKNEIIKNKGSIQKIEDIPKVLKERFKIVWEIPMKHILEMAADRGAYICQSQSTNLWMQTPSYDKLTAMHFFGWSKGLKTGIYYLRTKAKAAPQQFTIEPEKQETLDEDEECLMCGA